MLSSRPWGWFGVLAGAMLAFGMPGMALAGSGFGPAVDWSLTGQLKLTTEADLNRDLLPDETTAALSTTRFDAGLSLGAETKRGLYTVDVGLLGLVYLGPDQPETDQPVDPRFAASARYTGKRYELTSNFSFDIQPVSDTQFEDTGIVSNRTNQLTIRYSADLALQLSKRDTLTVSTSAGVIDFLDTTPGLVSNRNVTAGLGWTRALDARTTIGLDLSLSHFTSDNATETRSQTFGLGGRFSQQRTRRHTFGFSLGPTFVRTKERGQGVTFDVGFNASANFEYKLQDITFGLGLSQAIEPSAAGELQSFTRANSRMVWNVTARDTISLGADYTRRTGIDGGETLDTFAVNTSYDYALTRDTRLALGYRFRARNDDAGFATGHQVFLAVTYDFTLQP